MGYQDVTGFPRRYLEGWLNFVCCFCTLIFTFGQNELSSNDSLIDKIEFKPWELVNAVAWSPDGAFLSVANGNNIEIFASLNFDRIVELEIGAFTPALAFSPDSKQLASGSRDGVVRVWRVADLTSRDHEPGSLNPAWEVFAHRKGVNSLSFSPDSRILATGGNDAMARIWESTSGKSIQTMIGGTFAVSGVEFSSDGKTLAIVNGTMVRFREIETRRIIGSFRSDQPLFCIDLNPDGSLIAVGDGANRISIWQTAAAFRSGVEKYPVPVILTPSQSMSDGSRFLIWDITFNQDGSLLVAAGGDGQIRIWDAATGALIQTISGHRGAVTSLAIHPNGKLLTSGSLDGTVRMWNLININ